MKRRVFTKKVKASNLYLLEYGCMYDDSFIYRRNYEDEEGIIWGEICQMAPGLHVEEIAPILLDACGDNYILIDGADPKLVGELLRLGINVTVERFCAIELGLLDGDGEKKSMKEMSNTILRRIDCLSSQVSQVKNDFSNYWWVIYLTFLLSLLVLLRV